MFRDFSYEFGFNPALIVIFHPNKFYYQNQIHCHAEEEVATEVLRVGIFTAATNAIKTFVEQTGFVAMIELADRSKLLGGRIDRIKKMCDLPPLVIGDCNTWDTYGRVFVMIQANDEQGIYKTETKKTKVHSVNESNLRKIGSCYSLNTREFDKYSNCGRDEEYAYPTQIVRILNQLNFGLNP